MDREQLVEKMTESAAQGLHEAIFGVGVWQRILPGERAQWCGYVRAAMRAALGVAESVVREDERDEIIALIEATPTPGEADDTESGHRYAAGYRDASNCAADDLRRLRDRVVARTGGTP